MKIKRAKALRIILGVLFVLIIAPIAIASSSVAGHRAERRVILIGGYDTIKNITDPEASHTRANELPGWQSIVDYLTQDKGTTENALVRQIGLTNSDIFLFSYSNQYDPTCDGAAGYGCPRYTAKDTCLTSNNQRNQPLYCQVEEPAIAAVANYLTQIVSAYPDAEFDIIAHSEGGIVATYWAATARTSFSEFHCCVWKSAACHVLASAKATEWHASK